MNAKQNLLNAVAIATVLQGNPQVETIGFLNRSLSLCVLPRLAIACWEYHLQHIQKIFQFTANMSYFGQKKLQNLRKMSAENVY